MGAFPHVAIDVYDYSKNKVVNLYDSSLESPGQAFDIQHTNEISGWQELTFTMPYVMEGEYNHRWDYIKPDYKVCLTVGTAREWFFIRQPKGTHNSKSINRTVKCVAECDILKTKNIYAEFTDENGIGTLEELATRVLAGTGWHYGQGSDVPLEKDGTTVKKRSLVVSNKPGAYKLITTLCDLFKVYPVFDSDNHEVVFYGLNNRDIHREFMVGGASKDEWFSPEVTKSAAGSALVGYGVIGIMIVGFDHNRMFLEEGDEVSSAYGVTALTAEPDSSSVITRLYVEGQYGDDGYVGIDSANPTGLSYIMNFDYYKENGLFTPEHEAALQTYESEMASSVQAIREYTASMTVKSNELNTLWGIWNHVQYKIDNGAVSSTVRPIYVGIANEEQHGQIKKGDILLVSGREGSDYTRRFEIAGNNGNVSWQDTDEYAVKFIVANRDPTLVPQRVFTDNPIPPYSVGDMWWNPDTREVKYAQVDRAYGDEYQTVDWFDYDYYKPAGKVGYKESAIEAKEAVIKDLQREKIINDRLIYTYESQGMTVPEEYYTERDRIASEIARVRLEIEDQLAPIDDGNDGEEAGSTPEKGLRQLTYEAMDLASQLDYLQQGLETMQEAQSQIEDTFVDAMGDMLKDGRWTNNNYIVGQEQALYADAVEVLGTMSRPSIKYTVQRANLSANLGYTVEDFKINSQIRLYDPYLKVNDIVYIKKIVKHYDQPWKDTVEISNESEITISGKTLDSTLQRMATLANGLEQNQSVFERAKTITSEGTISVANLEGVIDLQRTKLESAISGWYTDDDGNIMFVSADGQSAMKLTGEGFAIAPNKNDDGTWNWRTFGTGRGFSADLIVAGLLSADRIEAGSITVQKLDAGVGAGIDLSSNQSIQLVAGQTKTLSETLTDVSNQAKDAADTAEDVQRDLAAKPNSFTTYFRRSTSHDAVLPADGSAEAEAKAEYKWSETAPAFKEGEYIWQKTVTTYTDAPDVVAGPTCLSGAMGQDGEPITIVTQETKYAVSSSGTTPPSTENDWHPRGSEPADYIPPANPGQYFWTRVKITYSDDTVSTSYSVSYQGDDGTGIASITPQYTFMYTEAAPGEEATWYDSYEALLQAHPWQYGAFLWIRNKIKKKVGTTLLDDEYTTPYCDPSWQVVDEIKVGADNLLTGTTNTSKKYTLNDSGYYFFTPSAHAVYSADEPTWTFDDVDEVGTGDTDQYVGSHWYTFRAWLQNNITIDAPNYHDFVKYTIGLRVRNVATGTYEDHDAPASSYKNGWMTVSVELPETGEYIVQAYVKKTQGQFTYAVVKCPKLELGNKPTEWCPSSSELNLQVVQAIQDDLQDQIDGQVITWYYDVTPTASNPPANSWTTTALKEEHLGDTYYNSTDGKAYEWTKDDTVSPVTYSWAEIEISNVTKALADAHNAQTTADHKRTVFTTTPSNYEEGDLWVDQNGDIKYATAARATYRAADWVQAANWGDIAESKIYSVVVEYRLSTSETQILPATSSEAKYNWNTTAPAWTDGEYMWQRTTTKKSADDQDPSITTTCISGARGRDGVAVKSVVNYYLATSSSTAPTIPSSGVGSWVTNIASTTFNATNKYLWNFERTFDTDDNKLSDTTPSLVVTWGQDNGAVSSITEQYRLSTGTAASSQVGSWVTTPPTMTEVNRFLWNREVIAYVNGQSYTGTARIIGAFGPKGDNGQDGTTIVGITYAASTSSTTAPSGTGVWKDTVADANVQPGQYLWTRTEYYDLDSGTTYGYSVSHQGVEVTRVEAQYQMIQSTDESDLVEADWKTQYSQLPQWQYGYYLWTRTMVYYNNGTSTPTEPYCDTSWVAIDMMEVGGDNLLFGTSRSFSDIINDSVNLTKDLQGNYTRIDMNQQSTLWLTLRAYIYVYDTNLWKLAIRAYPKNGATASLGQFILGKGTLGAAATDYFEFVADPATTADDGWTTITVNLPSQDFEVEAWILNKGSTSNAGMQYHSAKLELGTRATQWKKPAAESEAEFTALNTIVETQSQSLIDISDEMAEMKTVQQGYSETNRQLSERIGAVETTAGQVEAIAKEARTTVTEFNETLQEWETRVVIDPDGLILKQSQDPLYVARLTANRLDFVNSNVLVDRYDSTKTYNIGDLVTYEGNVYQCSEYVSAMPWDPAKWILIPYEPVASFGADGALIDRVRSREKLSVGTEDYGWYDMVVMKNGLADKWRDGENSTKQRTFISEQPTVQRIAAIGNTVTFSIAVDGPVTSYQWQYRYLSKAAQWQILSTTSSTDQTSTYSFTSDMETLGYEFRCVVNQTIVSNSVRFFVVGAPHVLTTTPAQVKTEQTLVCPAYEGPDGGAPTRYQWQTKDNESDNWVNFTNLTTRTMICETRFITHPTAYNYFRCIAYAGDLPAVTNEIVIGVN